MNDVKCITGCFALHTLLWTLYLQKNISMSYYSFVHSVIITDLIKHFPCSMFLCMHEVSINNSSNANQKSPFSCSG